MRRDNKNKSLKTLGCISSGPTDLRMFRFLRCSWTWSLLTVGGTLLPEPPSCWPATPEVWKQRRSPLKTGTQNLLSSSAFSSSNFTSFPAWFIKGWHLFWPSFPGCQTWRPSCHSLCPLPGSVLALPSSALPNTIKFHPETLPRSPSHVFTVCASPVPLVSPAGPSSAILGSSLPHLLFPGITGSGVPWKISLKICQLCSAPLSLSTASQGIAFTVSLKSWSLFS